MELAACIPTSTFLLIADQLVGDGSDTWNPPSQCGQPLVLARKPVGSPKILSYLHIISVNIRAKVCLSSAMSRSDQKTHNTLHKCSCEPADLALRNTCSPCKEPGKRTGNGIISA
jgi:hypothetical protein